MNEVEVEAFRADTKASKGLTAAHIAKAAALYNPETAPAPLVFGHPKNDSPSLGLVSAARAEGSKLFLKLKDIAAETVQAVKDRKILGRSIAFWDPDHPSNPNPGHYSIRHLGLLGGQAPAIANLSPLRFSAEEDALESDDGPADAIIYAVEDTPTRVQTVTEPRPKEPTMADEKTADELKIELAASETAREAAEKEAADLKAAAEKRDREFAAAEANRRTTENTAALDAVVAEGRVLPAEKDDLAQLFEALPVEAKTFAAGDIEPRVALANFLKGLPKRAPIGKDVKSPKEFADVDSPEAKEAAALAGRAKHLQDAYKGPSPTVQ